MHHLFNLYFLLLLVNCEQANATDTSGEQGTTPQTVPSWILVLLVFFAILVVLLLGSLIYAMKTIRRLLRQQSITHDNPLMAMGLRPGQGIRNLPNPYSFGLPPTTYGATRRTRSNNSVTYEVPPLKKKKENEVTTIIQPNTTKQSSGDQIVRKLKKKPCTVEFNEKTDEIKENDEESPSSVNPQTEVLPTNEIISPLSYNIWGFLWPWNRTEVSLNESTTLSASMQDSETCIQIPKCDDDIATEGPIISEQTQQSTPSETNLRHQSLTRILQEDTISLPSTDAEDVKTRSLKSSTETKEPALDPIEACSVQTLRFLLSPDHTKYKIFGNQEIHDTEFFLRFLRARDFDINKSSQMMLSYLQWRIKEVPEGVHIEQVREELASGKYYSHFRDLKGRPVLVLRARYHNKNRPIESTKSTVVYCLDGAISHFTAEATQFTGIIDLYGFGYQNADLNALRALVHMLDNYYPERLGMLWFIHVNFIFTGIWKIVRPFVQPRTASKIEFLGSDFKQKLAENIDPQYLPKMYGGKADDPPVKFIGSLSPPEMSL